MSTADSPDPPDCADSPDRQAPPQRACPACGAPITADDAFCESCGATLQPGAEPAPPDSDRSGANAATAAQPASECPACGGQILDDGFCGTCGRRALSARDRWEEHPADWIGGVCDKGVVHPRNEDAMALGGTVDHELAVLVVCDGVTTAPDSDRAALAAARVACAHLLAGHVAKQESSTAAVIERDTALLQAAAAEANIAVVGVARSLGNPPEPPSCTFVGAVITGDVVTVAWCGDSRAYWFPDAPAQPVQLTIDHSLGTEMVRAGQTEAEALADPRSHTITRWLGADSMDATPEVVSRRLDEPGWVLACTDGLWNDASPPAELGALVGVAVAAHGPDPVDVASWLVAWANEQGGHDNITAALARFDPSLR